MMTSTSKYRWVLTSTGDTVDWSKEHFEKLHNPVDMPSLQKAVPEISGVLESIIVTEGTMAVRNI